MNSTGPSRRDESRARGRTLSILAGGLIIVATMTPVRGVFTTASSGICLICGEVGGTDAIVNVLLFVPLGAGLAMARSRASRAWVAMFLASVVIELLQLSIIPGRDATVGDVVMNTLGGILGYLVGTRIDALIAPVPRTARLLTGTWLCLWITIQSVSSFSLRARPTNSEYFGQIARPLGDEPPFPGTVSTVTLDGRRIPDAELGESGWAREALARDAGATIGATVSLHAVAPRRSPIIRVLDTEHREELLVAADRSSLIFRVRTGAAALRLRPVTFRVDDVFRVIGSHDAAGNTATRLRMTYGADRVVIGAPGRHERDTVLLKIGAAEGWRLFFPWGSFVDGSRTQLLLDGLWLLAWMLPAGYWVGFAVDEVDDKRRFLLIFALFTGALVTGYAVAPIIFRLALPGANELIGGFAGIALGFGTQKRVSRRLAARRS